MLFNYFPTPHVFGSLNWKKGFLDNFCRVFDERRLRGRVTSLLFTPDLMIQLHKFREFCKRSDRWDFKKKGSSGRAGRVGRRSIDEACSGSGENNFVWYSIIDLTCAEMRWWKVDLNFISEEWEMFHLDFR